MSEVETVKREIANAKDLVGKFRAAVAAGEDVDYGHFNLVIEQACSAAISLPFDQVAEIRSDLTTLLDDLNLAKEELSAADNRLSEAAQTAG